MLLPNDQHRLDQSLKTHISRLRAEVVARSLSGPEEFEFLRVELSKMSDDLREPCEFLLFRAHSIATVTIEAKYAVPFVKERREKRYFFASLVMLAVVVGISLLIPDPSAHQISVLRLVMALASAAFVAFLPGMLTIQGTIPQGGFLNDAKVRATGAFAVFLLVYYYAPHIIK